MDLRLKIRINDLTEVQRTFKSLCWLLNPLPDNTRLLAPQAIFVRDAG